MQTVFLGAAAAVSATTFVVHTFVGGPRVARPLLADRGLPPASKWLNYYCWHVTTVLTFSMGWGYAYVALRPDRPELAVVLTAVAAALSVLSAAVARKARIHPLRFPSTSLFAATAVLGLVGLLVG